MRRVIRHLVVMASMALATLVLPTAHAQERIGVFMLHGKNPGSNSEPGMNRLKSALEGAGMLTAMPDMPWSRRRYLDGNWDKAMAEIASGVAGLRSQGATKIVVLGLSIGVPGALGYAARGGDVQALVLLGPGHVPLRFYNNPNITTVRESVDLARVLVKDGKGDTRRSFGDINQGRRLIVETSAKDYLSYFDPASDAEMSVTAPRVPATTPVMTVIGDEDPAFRTIRGDLFDRLPPNPKNLYLEVKAAHTTTPAAATDDVLKWIKSALAP